MNYCFYSSKEMQGNFGMGCSLFEEQNEMPNRLTQQCCWCCSQPRRDGNLL
uniref:Uncharacterized protein n=1 Tax=Rhizophora mucronata TaxID=61149 RepID=A0A2P2N648_RHIMU